MRGISLVGKYLTCMNEESIEEENNIPVLDSSSIQATTIVGTSCWYSPIVIVDDA